MSFFISSQESTGSLFFLCALKVWLCSQKYSLPLFRDAACYWIWASHCPVTKPPDQTEKTCFSVPYIIFGPHECHIHITTFMFENAIQGCHFYTSGYHQKMGQLKRCKDNHFDVCFLCVGEYAFLIILCSKVLECLSSSKCFCNFMNMSKVLCGNSVGKCRMTCT